MHGPFLCNVHLLGACRSRDTASMMNRDAKALPYIRATVGRPFGIACAIGFGMCLAYALLGNALVRAKIFEGLLRILGP
jgi:hypothetical protein